MLCTETGKHGGGVRCKGEEARGTEQGKHGPGGDFKHLAHVRLSSSCLMTSGPLPSGLALLRLSSSCFMTSGPLQSCSAETQFIMFHDIRPSAVLLC